MTGAFAQKVVADSKILPTKNPTQQYTIPCTPSKSEAIIRGL
jgi:hypothetical protein